MKTVTLLFLNFWEHFDPYNNKITNILKQKYNIIILRPEDNITPDLLIYSCFIKYNIYKYDCPKLYITGENDVPDFNICDYAIASSKLEFNKRYLYIPYFALFTDTYKKLWNTDKMFHSDLYDRMFCSCVVRNIEQADPMRKTIINAVDNYKPIAFGGSYRNNVSGPVIDKLGFINLFKFNIATENSNVAGYITEKIVDAYIANTIPIYWGTNDITSIFNPYSFINVNDYKNIDSFITALSEIDNNNELYMDIIQASPLLPNLELTYNEQIEKFLTNIIDNLHIKYTTKYGRVQIINSINYIIQ